MIQLFYTGALAPGTPQPDPFKSLGGYVSSSLLADDSLNNLFGDITPMGMQYAGPETFALALRNLSADELANVRIGYAYPAQCSVKLEVAAVGLYDDGCGKQTMQPLPTRRSRPQGAEFHELEMRRAEALLYIEAGVKEGDLVRLYIGDALLVDAVAPRAMDQQQTAAFLVGALEGFADFTAEVPQDLDCYVQLTRTQPGTYVSIVEFDTDGTGFAEPVMFKGGLDNSASLGKLAGKETLGLWFRRTLLPAATEPLPAKELERLPIGNRHVETLEIFISYDVLAPEVL